MFFALLVMAMATAIATLALLLLLSRRDVKEQSWVIDSLQKDVATFSARCREWERDMVGTVHALEQADAEAAVWHERSDALATANLELVESVTNLETSVGTLHAELVKHEIARAASAARRSGNPAKKATAKSVWS